MPPFASLPAGRLLLAFVACAGPLLGASFTFGPSPRVLGTNRENFQTPAYRIGAFGWFGVTLDEYHNGYYYPTAADYFPPSGFSIDAHNSARGDFNADGREDLVITWSILPHTIDRQARITTTILLNDGAGGLRHAPELFADGMPNRLFAYRTAVVDFNRDGRPDILAGGMGKLERLADGTSLIVKEPFLYVLSGSDGRLHDATRNIAGQENGGVPPGLGFPHDLAVGDVNGDGFPDFYSAKCLFLNDGTGRFSDATLQIPFEIRTSLAPIVMSSAIGDLNGDGIGDIVSAFGDGQPATPPGYVLLSQPGSTSVAGRPLTRLPVGRYGAGATKFNYCILYDVNRDGRLDIVFSVTRHTPYYVGRHLQVIMNRGGGSFVDESATRVVGADWLDQAHGEGSLHIVDVNNDGLADLVHSGGDTNSNHETPSLAIYLNGTDGVLRLMDRALLPRVQPWQLAGEENQRPFATRPLGRAYPVDLDGRGGIDFMATVQTPFHRWPQEEPSQFSLYSIIATNGDATAPSTLSNLSVRSQAGTGDRTLIVGFALNGGEGTKPLLVRAVGPTLASFGVDGTLADPNLEIAPLSAPKIAENNNWGGSASLKAAFSAVGAFALSNDTSRDAAIVVAPRAGAFTATVTGVGGTTGVALVELYDTVAGSAPRLSNVSARTQVGPGADALFVGFAVTGQRPKRVLIRAVGPTLQAFGVDGTLADPMLEVRPLGSEQVVAGNDDWGGTAALKSAFGSVGAFALSNDASRDAALVAELASGAYTATVVGKAATSGVALVEVYELP